MILIVTHSKDLSADFVIRHLLSSGCRYLRLDTDRLGSPDCFFAASTDAELHVDGRLIQRQDVTAIWARRFALPEILRQVESQYAEFIKRELSVVMDAFLEGSPETFQINPASVDRLAGNRIVQTQRAKRAGFAVPDMIVTQNSDEAREFLQIHPKVVCKALSFGYVSAAAGAERIAYTSSVPADLSLDGLAVCPALFQVQVPNLFDWRITTIGQRAFCARAPFDPGQSPIDWRQDDHTSTKFEKAEPPASVINRLLRLADESGLIYGAHDLIETETGEFYFLETNPAGQWGWLELTLGLPIGRAIADELLAHAL